MALSIWIQYTYPPKLPWERRPVNATMLSALTTESISTILRKEAVICSSVVGFPPILITGSQINMVHLLSGTRLSSIGMSAFYSSWNCSMTSLDLGTDDVASFLLPFESEIPHPIKAGIFRQDLPRPIFNCVVSFSIKGHHWLNDLSTCKGLNELFTKRQSVVLPVAF